MVNSQFHLTEDQKKKFKEWERVESEVGEGKSEADRIRLARENKKRRDEAIARQKEIELKAEIARKKKKSSILAKLSAWKGFQKRIFDLGEYDRKNVQTEQGRGLA